MALTDKQRQTTARMDLGGDGLEAIQGLRMTAEPRQTRVVVTTGQLTLDELIAAKRGAGNAILSTTRKVTLVPQATGIYFTTGGEACSPATGLPMGERAIGFDGTAESLAGLTFYAANVAMNIVEEG